MKNELRLHRRLSESEEWGLLALWRAGNDTYDISLHLGVHECQVANRLMHMRSRERAVPRNG